MNTASVICGFKWHVIGVPEVQQREGDTEKKMFKKTMVKNFPKLMKIVNS